MLLSNKSGQNPGDSWELILQLNDESFAEASEKAVKQDSPIPGWPVYEHYEIAEEDGETFVIAAVSPDSFIKSEPKQEGVIQEGEMKGLKWQEFEGRDPLEDAMILYPPLRTPELVIDLAELAEKQITPEDVLSWAQVYGLLGILGDDTVSTYDGFVNLRVSGWGRRESVRRFTEAAGEVRACLRIYEAVTADEDVDLDKLSSDSGPLPLEDLRQWDLREGEERSWLFHVLGRMVQTRLNEHCYPRFTTYTRGGLAAGKFALSWGFKNLLGAIWLHIAWLLEAEGERVRRCKLPGCLRVIHFEPGQPLANPGLKRNPRGRYKTRVDREFCKGRGCKQKYHYRKKAGWKDYS
jgi:hypothetical protein